MAKEGRFGPYVTEVLPQSDGASPNGSKKVKPRTGSLFKSMSLEEVTLDEALKLLSLPRVVGKDPRRATRSPRRTAATGPTCARARTPGRCPQRTQIFTVTLAEALKIYAEPKKRGRAAAASAPPLKELGKDPVSGKPMVVKDGRFGPYVTDGEFNASLRKSDSVETLSDERAAELLAEKRAKGPAPKKRPPTRRKAPTKSKP